MSLPPTFGVVRDIWAHDQPDCDKWLNVKDFVAWEFVFDSAGAEGQLCVFGEKRSGGGGMMH